MYLEDRVKNIEDNIGPDYCAACDEYITNKDYRYRGLNTTPITIPFCDNCLESIRLMGQLRTGKYNLLK